MKQFFNKIENFLNLNRTSFCIAFLIGAFAVQYQGNYGWIFHISFYIILIFIFISKLIHHLNIIALVNYIKKSPLNLVLGALGTGKTALMSYVGYLFSKFKRKKKYNIAATYPLLNAQMLSLGHMNLLDQEYPILPTRTLLLWDEANLFLEGIEHQANNSRYQGMPEYFSLLRHFGHIALISGQRAENVWVKIRDIVNSVIVGIVSKPVNIFRPYFKVIYGTFKSVTEYEKWRDTLIVAKNNKKGKKTKYRNIPELDIYFFKLKIPISVLETYNSYYMAFIRELANGNTKYINQFYNQTEIDIKALEYLKMEKFSDLIKKIKEQ